jgi:formamidopyrimidine-DNA glycosylase
MPELPEVEVLRRSLESELVGARVCSVGVRSEALREPLDSTALQWALTDHRIMGLRRRAKYLLIDMASGWTAVVHLGMSGRLTLEDRGVVMDRHDHVVIALDSGWDLRFRDPRRFGLFLVLPTEDLEGDRHFSHLGEEPLGGELSPGRLIHLAKGRRGPVKNFLMNQRVVVGIGNIYASEALLRAGIHPKRSVARISGKRWAVLVESVQATLTDALRAGGTTLNDYTDGKGASGLFQVELSVYGREGQPCRSCAGKIRRIVQAGRSTFYCPGCQH